MSIREATCLMCAYFGALRLVSSVVIGSWMRPLLISATNDCSLRLRSTAHALCRAGSGRRQRCGKAVRRWLIPAPGAGAAGFVLCYSWLCWASLRCFLAGWFQAFKQCVLVSSRRCSGTSRSAALRSSRFRIAMIWRAYSLGHVTAVCRDCRQIDTQLFR